MPESLEWTLIGLAVVALFVALPLLLRRLLDRMADLRVARQGRQQLDRYYSGLADGTLLARLERDGWNMSVPARFSCDVSVADEDDVRYLAGLFRSRGFEVHVRIEPALSLTIEKLVLPDLMSLKSQRELVTQLVRRVNGELRDIRFVASGDIASPGASG